MQLFREVAKIPEGAISDEAAVSDELQMESVAFVEIQVAVQDEYDIELDPIHLIELDQFGAIVNHIYECASKSRP